MSIGTIIFGVVLFVTLLSSKFIISRIKNEIRKNDSLVFIFKDKKTEINIAIYVILATAILLIITQIFSGKNLFPIEKVFIGLNWWSEILDPLLGVTIALIALGIWVNKNQEEWEDDIEKTLTIIFMYNNLEVMRCVKVYLAGESDIRAWAQQIGSQMCMSLLEFEPFIDPGPSKTKYRNDQWFKDYYVVYKLRNLPFPTHKPLKRLEIKDEKDKLDGEYVKIVADKNAIIDNRNKESKASVEKIFKTLYIKKGCIVWHPTKNLSTEKLYLSRKEFNENKERIGSDYYIDPDVLSENIIISSSIAAAASAAPTDASA